MIRYIGFVCNEDGAMKYFNLCITLRVICFDKNVSNIENTADIFEEHSHEFRAVI